MSDGYTTCCTINNNTQSDCHLFLQTGLQLIEKFVILLVIAYSSDRWWFKFSSVLLCTRYVLLSYYY